MRLVRVSARGQLVLPKEIRERLGLVKGSLCRVELDDGRAIVVPVGKPEPGDWRRWEGVLKGTRAVEDHLAEHRNEVAADAARRA